MAEKLRTKGYFYRIKEDKPVANDSSLLRFYVRPVNLLIISSSFFLFFLYLADIERRFNLLYF